MRGDLNSDSPCKGDQSMPLSDEALGGIKRINNRSIHLKMNYTLDKKIVGTNLQCKPQKIYI